MEINVPICIDEELNVVAMDFHQMTKDNKLLQCTTLKPPKTLVVVGHIWNKVCVCKKTIVI
jgi:hypothetical protein